MLFGGAHLRCLPMRVLTTGLLVLCVGCSGGAPPGQSRERAQATEGDAGAPIATEPDGGAEPDRCTWVEHWRTDIDQDTPCHWGMRSLDTEIVLFRSLNGVCLTPATICGEPACAELAEVRERNPVELWGPPGLDGETVWSAAEWFACE